MTSTRRFHSTEFLPFSYPPRVSNPHHLEFEGISKRTGKRQSFSCQRMNQGPYIPDPDERQAIALGALRELVQSDAFRMPHASSDF